MVNKALTSCVNVEDASVGWAVRRCIVFNPAIAERLGANHQLQTYLCGDGERDLPICR